VREKYCWLVADKRTGRYVGQLDYVIASGLSI
jgi:hypothetical protein